MKDYESPEYRIWANIKGRCLCRTNRAFKNYGGRGIGISLKWQASFQAFLADVGPRPSPAPGNVRWTDRKTQNRNMRTNHLLSHGGKTMCIAEWSDHINVPTGTIHASITAGWTVERALTTPVLPNGSWTKPRNYGCSECGPQAKYFALGFCKPHFQRFESRRRRARCK